MYNNKPVSKVVLRPLNGRRHQLRLHCVALGFPIVGDATYGHIQWDTHTPRMMLHAFRLQAPCLQEVGLPYIYV